MTEEINSSLRGKKTDENMKDKFNHFISVQCLMHQLHHTEEAVTSTPGKMGKQGYFLLEVDCI